MYYVPGRIGSRAVGTSLVLSEGAASGWLEEPPGGAARQRVLSQLVASKNRPQSIGGKIVSTFVCSY